MYVETTYADRIVAGDSPRTNVKAKAGQMFVDLERHLITSIGEFGLTVPVFPFGGWTMYLSGPISILGGFHSEWDCFKWIELAMTTMHMGPSCQSLLTSSADWAPRKVPL